MMGINPKIALIGFRGLPHMGLRSLFEEEGLRTEGFPDFESFSEFSEKSDLYVVHAREFLKGLDYFLPRKSKCLLMTDGALCGDIPMPHVCGTDSDEAEISGCVNKLLKNHSMASVGDGALSSRELEVLRLIAAGKLNKEIADCLNISINTVITHRKNLSGKLGIKSASGLSLYAVMNGLA